MIYASFCSVWPLQLFPRYHQLRVGPHATCRRESKWCRHTLFHVTLSPQQWLDASRNAVIFRASDASAHFVTRNPELLDLLALQFEERLRQYKAEDSFIELVHRAIQDRLTGQRPSIDAISQVPHMGPRTRAVKSHRGVDALSAVHH